MFYPETFLYGDLTEEELTNDTAAIYVPVPNQRSGEANAPADFAYGSYRLQIRLDPGKHLNIGLRIPGIQLR